MSCDDSNEADDTRALKVTMIRHPPRASPIVSRLVCSSVERRASVNSNFVVVCAWFILRSTVGVCVVIYLRATIINV